jgi:hypothetical protein
MGRADEAERDGDMDDASKHYIRPNFLQLYKEQAEHTCRGAQQLDSSSAQDY